MKHAEKIFTILCDDIRNEVGNKMSFMGIYPENIVLHQSPPMFLPKACLAITVEGVKKQFSSLKIILKSPESDPFEFTLEAPPAPGKKKNPKKVFMALMLSPLKIQAPGPASFELYFGSESKPEHIHEFEIQVDTKSPSGP